MASVVMRCPSTSSQKLQCLFHRFLTSAWEILLLFLTHLYETVTCESICCYSGMNIDIFVNGGVMVPFGLVATAAPVICSVFLFSCYILKAKFLYVIYFNWFTSTVLWINTHSWQWNSTSMLCSMMYWILRQLDNV